MRLLTPLTLKTIDLQALNRSQMQMYCRLLKEQGIDNIKLNATNQRLRQHLQKYVSQEAIAANQDDQEPENDDEDEDLTPDLDALREQSSAPF